MRFAILLAPFLLAFAPMMTSAQSTPDIFLIPDGSLCDPANPGQCRSGVCMRVDGESGVCGTRNTGGSFGGGGSGGSSQTFGGGGPGGPGGSSQTFGGGGPGPTVGLENPLGTTDLMTLLMRILEFVIRIGAIVVVFMLVYVGFMFATGPANPKRIEDAKKYLLYTVIGALILLGSQAIALGIAATVKALSVGQ